MRHVVRVTRLVRGVGLRSFRASFLIPRSYRSAMRASQPCTGSDLAFGPSRPRDGAPVLEDRRSRSACSSWLTNGYLCVSQPANASTLRRTASSVRRASASATLAGERREDVRLRLAWTGVVERARQDTRIPRTRSPGGGAAPTTVDTAGGMAGPERRALLHDNAAGTRVHLARTEQNLGLSNLDARCLQSRGQVTVRIQARPSRGARSRRRAGMRYETDGAPSKCHEEGPPRWQARLVIGKLTEKGSRIQVGSQPQAP